MSSEGYYIGIDVGTGSVRAGLVKPDGSIAAISTEATQTFRDPDDHRIFEQSTTDIWNGIGKTIKTVLKEANVTPEQVKGLGFDATCSLAVTDTNGDPVVATGGADLGQNGDRNIILWADHRAEEEANLINGTGSKVLDYVGGVMSVCFDCYVSMPILSNLDCVVGNGDPKDPLAQTSHETRALFSLPIL